MKKNTIYLMTIIFIAGSFILLSPNVFAQNLNNQNNNNINKVKLLSKKKIHRINKKLAKKIRKALLAKDYNKWKKLIKEFEKKYEVKKSQSILNKIKNKKDFDLFAKKMIRQNERRIKIEELKNEIRNSIKENNYPQWQELIAELESLKKDYKQSLLDKIQNEKDFQKLRELYLYHQRIKKLEKELNL